MIGCLNVEGDSKRVFKVILVCSCILLLPENGCMFSIVLFGYFFKALFE